ncbi:MAG: hypothetical protein RLY31_2187 [Bacteroidota bacterium]|jgi:hypothetical protein
MSYSVTSVLLFLCLLSACHLPRHTADTLPDDQLVIGSGNSNDRTESYFVLLKNGQVFSSDGQDSVLTERQALSPRAAADFFEQAARLQLHRLDIQHPGNLHYFLQVASPLAVHRVTWGAGDYLPPTNVIRLYRSLANRLAALPARTTTKSDDLPARNSTPAPPAPTSGGW